jgi:hypothetical protein
MSKQTINIGASPNDGTGTPLRTSFDYTNQNFTELYTALGGGVGLPGATTQVIFNDGGTNLAGDAGLVYNKTTDALTVAGLVTAGSAAITGAATVGTTLGVTGVSTFAAGTVSLPALTTTGDTNTGIYYPAADTFAVTTGGVERYRVDSSGNFLIGTPTALGKVRVRGGSGQNFVVDVSNSNQVSLQNYGSTGDGGWQELNLFASPITFSTGTAGGTSGSEKARIDASGNLSLALGNLVMTTSGKGIDFSAVTGGTGTATANVLNDYEEGTFTPTVTSVGGTGIVYVPVGDTGTYTKIGRLVTFTVNLNGTYTGTFSYIRIALPFTVGSAYDAVSGYNNSTALALAGRTDPTAARFIVGIPQPSGDLAIYTGSYNV